jgi:hypothetical protein
MNRRKFQKIAVKGFIAVTQKGALIASTIRPHPEGDFPTVWVKSESVPAGAIARQVRVTVELWERQS